nr:F-box domain, leucine-rich repeat domain, L domain-like protein [Tanacetum cinerariifolium]
MYPAVAWVALLTETQFDLRPHMESPDWTEINAGIQQHLQKAYNTNKAAFKAQHWVIDPTTGTYNVEKIWRERWRILRPASGISILSFGMIPGTLPKPLKISKTRQRERSYLDKDMLASTTQDYPSLIGTFFVAHTINGDFLRDEDRRIYEEMRRLEAMGTYTDDEINRLAKGGKQRGHITGVGRFESGGASGSCECGDEEEGADHQDDEDEDGNGDT